MRRTGLAFRMLLSLLLVLNGIGSAVAGVRMAMPAMADTAVQDAVADASLPPCHRAAMADATPVTPMPMPPAGDHRQGDGDCCTSGACDAAGCPCPCTALAVALWPMPPALATRALALPPPAVRIAPHPSPPRHQPDRPPIA